MTIKEESTSSSTLEVGMIDTIAQPDSKLKKYKIYFWEKWALKPEDEDYEKLNFYEIEDDDLRANPKTFLDCHILNAGIIGITEI